MLGQTDRREIETKDHCPAEEVLDHAIALPIVSRLQGSMGPGRGASRLPVPTPGVSILPRASRIQSARVTNMPLAEALEPFLG
jgi:hypothetical protein